MTEIFSSNNNGYKMTVERMAFCICLLFSSKLFVKTRERQWNTNLFLSFRKNKECDIGESEVEQMARTKTTDKASVKNGRAKRGGEAYNANHNTLESTRLSQAHIDQHRTPLNVYLRFSETGNMETIRGGEGGFNAKEHELDLYEKIYGEGLEARNQRYIKQGHKERCQTMQDLYSNPKTAPMETIFQVGSRQSVIEKDIRTAALKKAWALTIDEFRKHYADNFIAADMALHLDEAEPHIHFRYLLKAEDRYGHFVPNQNQALKAMGFERPDPEKPESRYNNALMSFTDKLRETFYRNCERQGIQIDREVENHSKRQVAILELKCAKLREEVQAAQREAAQSRQEAAEAAVSKQTLEERVKTLQGRIAALERRVELRRNDFNEVQEEVRELETKRSDLQTEKTDLEQKVATAQQEAAQSRQEAQEAAITKQTVEEQVNTLQREIAALRGSQAALEQDKKELTVENDNLRQENAALQQNNADLKQDNEKIKKDKDELRKRYQALEKESEGLEMQLEELKRQKQQAEAEKVQAQKERQIQVDAIVEIQQHSKDLYSRLNTRKLRIIEKLPAQEEIKKWGKVVQEAKPARTVVVTEDLEKLCKQAEYNVHVECNLERMSKINARISNDEIIQGLQAKVASQEKEIKEKQWTINTLRKDNQKLNQEVADRQDFMRRFRVENTYQNEQYTLNQSHNRQGRGR